MGKLNAFQAGGQAEQALIRVRLRVGPADQIHLVVTLDFRASVQFVLALVYVYFGQAFVGTPNKDQTI